MESHSHAPFFIREILSLKTVQNLAACIGVESGKDYQRQRKTRAKEILLTHFSHLLMCPLASSKGRLTLARCNSAEVGVFHPKSPCSSVGRARPW
jgi:hypothetical protein